MHPRYAGSLYVETLYLHIELQFPKIENINTIRAAIQRSRPSLLDLEKVPFRPGPRLRNRADSGAFQFPNYREYNILFLLLLLKFSATKKKIMQNPFS